ncbi:PP2C family serine/threonine-protein phosphatase [Aestuariivirga litoralis]|uniref:PP2C family serine/threonine-protein phosphatase n=1 Tax=Aestuariivirga litoralis TaxID=2650924 RepID=UPI0018C4E19F|nr:PP2C family serine/threonine-protein phosphatase [Aestuariivirga litoralis]MBG1233907.1 protein phosphatase 2C domain-containing protein [Aestuariivirga litoralis]
MSKALIAGASVQGAAHKLRQQPNQDFHGAAPVGAWQVLTVSDGHGATPHFRSDRGSRFAVEAARLAFAALTAKDQLDVKDRQKFEATFKTFPQELVAQWRKLVRADVKKEPLAKGDIFIPYGATCLSFCIGPGFAFYAQVGDGDLVAASADGKLGKPLPDDEGLEGQQTYSLCQDDAESHFRLALHVSPDPLAKPAFVLLATDGLSKSFTGGTQFMDTVRHLLELALTQDMSQLSKDLVPWLDDVSAHGVGDDTTVLLFKDPNQDAALQVGLVRRKNLAGNLKRFLRLQ